MGKTLMNREPSLPIDLKRKSDRYRNAKRAGKSDSEIEAELESLFPCGYSAGGRYRHCHGTYRFFKV